MHASHVAPCGAIAWGYSCTSIAECDTVHTPPVIPSVMGAGTLVTLTKVQPREVGPQTAFTRCKHCRYTAACLCVAHHAPYDPRRSASTHSLYTLLSKHVLRALWPTPCTFGAPVIRIDMCFVIHGHCSALSLRWTSIQRNPSNPNARPTSHKRSTDGIDPARLRLKVPRAFCHLSPCVGRPWRRAHT